MIYPETALFVVNYILSRRPRTPSPRREEIPYYGSIRRPVSLNPAYSSRRGLQDYWVSPQRYYAAGSAWQTASRRLLILPGSTGVSEVESTHWPSSGRYRHHLIWKQHWQNLNHHYLGKRHHSLAFWR
ncbi:uncharacterized protein LOC143837512 isoform X2 [Paroedura picta]|uniref:uncharacterized protein LOC143837512 isoform X2 n=1 Tax=Paroedura picta TaxID=143630 RepID=UPI00405646F4